MELTGIASGTGNCKIKYEAQTPRSKSKEVDGTYIAMNTLDGLKMPTFPRELTIEEKDMLFRMNIIYSERTSQFSGEGLRITTYYYTLKILEGPNKGKILEAEVSKG